MFNLSGFLIYCFITAYSPGANNLVSMNNAARLGLRRSIRFNIGVTTGFLVVMGICTFFSSVLYPVLPKVKMIMQVTGAAYMLFLAWKIWKSSASLETESGEGAGFLSGMVLQFINPKIYIYAVTAMSLYILPVYNSVTALTGFVLVLSVIGASGSFVWALSGSMLCSFFVKHANIINRVMALLLGYCAVSLFL